jgi:hypothetical protein
MLEHVKQEKQNLPTNGKASPSMHYFVRWIRDRATDSQLLEIYEHRERIMEKLHIFQNPRVEGDYEEER